MIDLDKIRQKVQQMSGNKKSDLWSPKPASDGKPKEYSVRILPWPDGNDGQPFKERSFYYNVGTGGVGKPILAPSQFKQEDPIQDLINKLRSDGSPGALEMCKKLYPKRRYYAPVLVRDEEGEGVRLWSFGKQVANELLQAILGDFGDITDPTSGRDIKVTALKVAGKSFSETKVMPRVKSTPLGTDKQMKEWLSKVPSLEEIYTLTPVDEIEKRVNDLINGPSSSEGTEVKQTKQKSSSAELTMDDTSNMEDVFSQLDSISSED